MVLLSLPLLMESPVSHVLVIPTVEQEAICVSGTATALRVVWLAPQIVRAQMDTDALA